MFSSRQQNVRSKKRKIHSTKGRKESAEGRKENTALKFPDGSVLFSQEERPQGLERNTNTPDSYRD